MVIWGQLCFSRQAVQNYRYRIAIDRAEKKACLAVKDLYSKWQGGEMKLQLVMRFLAAARLCMDEKLSKRNVY